MSNLEIRVEPHEIEKRTPFGTVKQQLNQHRVFILNDDTGKFTHCGFVGTKAFLPLSGFPKELVEDVTVLCAAEVGRELFAGKVPLSTKQIEKLEGASKGNDEEPDFIEEDEE